MEVARKSQIPKSQIPKKSQIPNNKISKGEAGLVSRQAARATRHALAGQGLFLEFWDLRFWDFFGIWDFGIWDF